mgnify:CR=1 FL=1
MTIEVCFAQGTEILELQISQNEQNPLLISLRKISLVHCIQYVSLTADKDTMLNPVLSTNEAESQWCTAAQKSTAVLIGRK